MYAKVRGWSPKTHPRPTITTAEPQIGNQRRSPVLTRALPFCPSGLQAQHYCRKNHTGNEQRYEND